MRIVNEPIAKQLLGSKVKRRILQFLLTQQGSVSERELARIIGVSHTAVNKAMRQLLELNVVKGRSVGSAIAWETNEKSLAFPYVKSLIEATNVTPLDLVKRKLKASLEFVNLCIGIVNAGLKEEGRPPLPRIQAAYIFGSVAKGMSSPESDIDVLVILESECRDKDLVEKTGIAIGKDILEATGNMASFHVYYDSAIKRNEPSWLKDAVEGGIRVI